MPKFLATPLSSLVVDEENLVIGFGLPTLEMLPPSLLRPTQTYFADLHITIKSDPRLKVGIKINSWCNMQPHQRKL